MRDAQSAFDQVIAFAGTTIDRRRRGDGARAGRPRSAVRHADGGGRRGRARRRSRWPAAPSKPATTCGSCAASWRALVRDLLLVVGRSGARRRSRGRGRGRARAAGGARPRFSREDLLRAFDLLDAGRAGRPRRRAAALSTSRWRCCDGCTCASWCRSTDLLAGARARRRRAGRHRGPPRPASPAAEPRQPSVPRERGRRSTVRRSRPPLERRGPADRKAALAAPPPTPPLSCRPR